MLVAAIAGGLVALLASAPIGSGDYGQWLMVSRYFAGQSEPAYRPIAELPPLVPWALAIVRIAVPDPILALRVISSILGRPLSRGSQ